MGSPTSLADYSDRRLWIVKKSVEMRLTPQYAR